MTPGFLVRSNEDTVANNFKAKGRPGLECGVGHVKFGMLIKLASRLRGEWDPLGSTVNTIHKAACAACQVVNFMSVLSHALP